MKRLIKYATLLACDRAKEEGLENGRERERERGGRRERETNREREMEKRRRNSTAFDGVRWTGSMNVPERTLAATSVSKFL